MEFKRIAIDTSKHVFTLHGVDDQERPVLRRDLSAPRLEAVLQQAAPNRGGSGSLRRLAPLGPPAGPALGHQVRLIPPQYVKPFVKRGKNDRNDAEAINEAASRPGMRYVPVKTAEQQADSDDPQASRAAGRATHPAGSTPLRGHAAEFGVVAAKGTAQSGRCWQTGRRRSGAESRAKAMFGAHGRAHRRRWISGSTALETTDDAAQGQPGQPAAGGGPRRRPDQRDHPGA